MHLAKEHALVLVCNAATTQKPSQQQEPYNKPEPVAIAPSLGSEVMEFADRSAHSSTQVFATTLVAGNPRPAQVPAERLASRGSCKRSRVQTQRAPASLAAYPPLASDTLGWACNLSMKACRCRRNPKPLSTRGPSAKPLRPSLCNVRVQCSGCTNARQRRFLLSLEVRPLDRRLTDQADTAATKQFHELCSPLPTSCSARATSSTSLRLAASSRGVTLA